MNNQRRWMTSILAASTQATPALPFARGQRSRPASLAPSSLSPTMIRAAAAQPALRQHRASAAAK